METPASGKLLIAEPFLLDSHFSRSVILLCEHEEQAGSIGFVLNRLLPEKLEDFFPELKSTGIPIYYGGPVQQDRLHFLHQLNDIIDVGLEVMKGIYWGGNFHYAKTLIEEGNLDLSKIKFFLGYSGWEKQQLNDELKENTWIVATADDELIFHHREEDIWKASLQRLGGEYAQMVNFPIHPSLN